MYLIFPIRIAGSPRESIEHVPSDKLIENVDIFLHVRHLHGLFGIEDRERGRRGAVFDVAASRLQEAPDEEDLEKSVGILEELERGAGLD